MTSIVDALDGHGIYIDGGWRAGGAGRFEDVSPNDGRVFATVADADERDMAEAVTAARAAFDSGPWPRLTGEQRSACLTQLAQALTRHVDDFSELAALEWGVANDHAAQVRSAASITASNAALAAQPDVEEIVGPRGSRGAVRHLPVGVVAAITPWNYPHALNLTKVTGAIASGNTIVLKPSPLSPLAAVLLARVVHDETDIPRGVVNVVATASTVTAESLTADDRVDLVSFTGSTQVGRRIAASAGAGLKRVLLELGGKSAMVHLDDLDDDAYDDLAPRTLFEGCIRHSGQACVLTSRLLVPARRHDEVVDRLAALAAKVVVGDPRVEGTQMGPMISAQQADAVRDKVDGAVRAGARVAFGGGQVEVNDGGAYMTPTILAGVTNDMAIAQEEVFGPVLSVIAYEDDDAAVAIANDSRYGLVGSVWGADPDRARQVAARMRTGQVAVNGASPLGPFGGFRESGIGREQGLIGLRHYTETSTVSTMPEVS
jgi:aldehyde dehydrogenase (NAD+)